MAFVISTLEMLTAAASDLANIGSTIGAANAAAATPTTGLIPAAADEVSAALAAMFGTHGRAYQAVSAQEAPFHNEFVQALNAGAGAYANADGGVGSPGTLGGGSGGAGGLLFGLNGMNGLA